MNTSPPPQPCPLRQFLTGFDWPRDECADCGKSLSDCTCEGAR